MHKNCAFYFWHVIAVLEAISRVAAESRSSRCVQTIMQPIVHPKKIGCASIRAPSMIFIGGCL
jgi:hypothetical protein